MQRPDWGGFRSGISHFFQAIRQRLTALLGDVSWSPPPWWNRLRTRFFSPERQQQVLAAWSKIRAWVQVHRRPLIIGSGVFVAAVLAGIAGYIWYQSLPKPIEFSVSGTAPSATPLIDNARPEAIQINFGGSAARLDQVDKVVTSGIQITPPIAGEWRWGGDSSLIFTPKEDWSVAQDYVVKLDPVLFPEHIRLQRYEYRFSSAPFTASIASLEFYQDPKNQKLKKIVATVRFSHPVDSADFEKRIALRMAGEKAGFLGFGSSSYPFTVSYNKFKGEAYIHSDPVKIPEKDSSMALVIDSGARSERGGNATSEKLERTVAIPGMYNFFRIQSAQLSLVRNERYEPEQVLVLNTTDGVQEEILQKAMKAYVLPRDLPAMQGQPERKNIHWYRAEQIGPEILAQAKALELKPLPTDKEFATLHSFKYQAEPGQFVYIKVDKGIQSAGGYVLAKVFDVVQRVPEFPRELNIMYDGAVLSLNGEKKVTVVARDIEAVRFEIGRVLPGQINHLVTQSGGTFRNPYFNSYQFSEDNITEHFSEARELKSVEHGKSQYASFDLTPYLSVGGARRGLFFFKVESWDAKNKRSLGKPDARLLLVTDLGLIAKNNADGSHDVFVQSIATGRPVAGARVEVLGKNGLTVVSDTTDGDGRASLPKLKDFKREKTPVAYVVRHGDDLAFLPFDRSDRQLNFSRFDIGGETSSQAGERLTAYLFSDRGIYRPGDAIHVGYIVKSQNWQDALAGVPIETVVTDARGLEVQRRKQNLSASGFEEISFQPEETAPTGNYQFAVYIVKDNRRSSLLGSTSVRVEEFLPDRLKISTHFSQERAEGWVSPAALKGRVQLMNLFGTPATNRRVSAGISSVPSVRGLPVCGSITGQEQFHRSPAGSTK
jgi:alpha-2-macroglobulin